VKKPFFYKLNVTKRTCLLIIAISWFIGIIFSDVMLAMLGYGPTLFTTAEKRSNIAKVFWLVTIEISYFSVLIVFAITAYSVRKSQANAKKSLWKLAVIVGVFAVLNSLEGAGRYLLVQVSFYQEQTQFFYAPISENCIILNADEFGSVKQQMYTLLVWYCLFVTRMTADPIANFLIDKKLRNVLKEDLNHVECAIKQNY
jgi:hypothetical protein